MVELEVGFHHECPNSDDRNSGLIKLMMKLHHESPRVIELEVGFHLGCFIRK